MRQKTHQQGFTLVEMVMVIVIMGVIGGMVSVFMKSPIDAYFASARRAALTDVADTTVRRMARDIRSAVPNSIRLSGNYLEFVPIKDAGRYRAEVGSGTEDILDFASATDSSFAVLGPAVTVSAGDSIVIYNLGIPGSDVYEGTSRRAAVSGGGSVSYTVGASQFPFASPANRFQVVGGAVTYECAANAGTLRRYSGYAIQSAPQPTPPGGTQAILASNVAACSFSYSGSDLQRNALVQIKIDLTSNGETVSLYHEVHVDNTP